MSSAFFGSEDQDFGIMRMCLIAATGPWSRLLFSFIFSHLVRHYDVRLILVFGMFAMSAATFCIGWIPDFSNIGVTSIVLLVVFRVVQGIAFSVEMPNSLIFGSLYLPKIFNIFSSITISNAAFGGVLAHAIMWLLEIYFSKQQMSEWAWRIPFFLGSLIGFVGIVMRRKLIFRTSYLVEEAQVKASSHLSDFFRLDIWNLVKVALLWIIPLSMIFNYMSFPYLFSKNYGFSSQSIYPATILGLIVSGLYGIAFGKFTQAFGFAGKVQHHLIFYALFMTVAWIFLGKSIISIYIFCGLYQIVLTSLMNIASKLSLRVLKTESRVFVIAYNAANAISSFITFFIVPGKYNAYFALLLIFSCSVYMISVDKRSRAFD